MGCTLLSSSCANIRRVYAEIFTMDSPGQHVAVEKEGIFIGIVSYYWEDESSKWLEAGIVLYESSNWGKGIGTRVFKMWLDHLFQTLPLVRVGFTT